jgi:hypothetical protein
MKTKITIIALVAAATMLPALASAADVSGVWVRDAAASNPFPDTMYWLVRAPPGGGGGNRPFVMTVKQDPASLVVTAQDLLPMRKVDLDGKPHVIPTGTLIQKATVTANNQADAVVITTTQPFGGMPGNAPLTIKESWALSPDGKTLTVTSVRSLPARTATDKQVYKRQP